MGIYGAKKVVEFARAFLKARKEASEEKETVVVLTKDAKDGEGEEGEAEVSRVVFARSGFLSKR